MSNKKLLIIAGPTGTGKTKLALNLARQTNLEIISADSRQVYKGLDYISNKMKINNDQLNQFSKYDNYWIQNNIKINGYDVIDLHQHFSVGQFVEFAVPVIKELWSNNQMPVIVGGTGYYIDALIGSKSYSEIAQDPSLRQSLETKSVIELQNILQELDHGGLISMPTHEQLNPHRLIRYIEIARITGNIKHGVTHSPLKEIIQNEKIQIEYLYLSNNQSSIYQSVDVWVSQLINSTEYTNELTLISKTKNVNQELLRGLLIKEGLQYLSGEITKEDLFKESCSRLHHYVRRQLIWFNKSPFTQKINIADHGWEDQLILNLASKYN